MSRLPKVLLARVLPLGLGVFAIWPVIASENGYVAGYIFLPLFILVILGTVALLITGAVVTGITGRKGLWVLMSGPMLFCGFFGGALVASHFEIGAYREEPMVPLIPERANIVLFKKGTTDAEIEDFWQNTLGTTPADGRGYGSLPGIQETGRLFTHDGHETVEFGFFDSATDEQRQEVYSRVETSPIVERLLTDEPTTDYMPKPEPPVNNNHPTKKVVTSSSATSSN